MITQPLIRGATASQPALLLYAVTHIEGHVLRTMEKGLSLCVKMLGIA